MIENPDCLLKEYTEGVLTVRQIAERHKLTVNEVQQFAYDNDLSHGSFKELVKQGVQMRLAYGGNKPDGIVEDIGERNRIVLQNSIERGVEAKSKHRMAIDVLFKLQELLAEAAVLEVMAMHDPTRFHPDDMRVLAAKAMRGQKESIADQALKLTEITENIIRLDLANVGLEEKKSESSTNVNVNINGQPTNQNQTAMDERSKLAAVAGMLEMLKARRELSKEEY